MSGFLGTLCTTRIYTPNGFKPTRLSIDMFTDRAVDREDYHYF